MQEEFVTYELALKLKEIGFDKACLAFSYIISEYGYKEHELYLVDSFDELIKNTEHTYYYARPTYEQAFDWFRKRYSKNSWIGDHYSSSTPGYFEYTYHISIMQGGIIKSGRYKTYQEARQACLKKLIELCKKN